LSILDFNDEPKRRSSAWLAVFLLLSISIAYFGFKTTLAANVTINGGSAVEFGQGLAQTTSCSGGQSIIITPLSSFTNSAGSTGSFKFSSFKVSNIPSSCYGFDFSVSAYDSTTGTNPLAIFNSSSTSATIYNNNGFFSTGIDGAGLTTATISSSSFSATFDTPVTSAPSVYKITIQSSLHKAIPCSQLNGDCKLGDTGPGGGTVFYVNVGGFTCGPTLNKTCHYMEVPSTNTWSGGGTDPSYTYAVSAYQNTLVPNLATQSSTVSSAEIGLGYQSSVYIVNQNGTPYTYAAGAARAYSGGSQNDWYLPNTSEANQLCKYANGQPWVSDATMCTGASPSLGLSLARYWTTSEYNNQYASVMDFAIPQLPFNLLKSYAYQIRPIRSF
jgi:hypothetical protein